MLWPVTKSFGLKGLSHSHYVTECITILKDKKTNETYLFYVFNAYGKFITCTKQKMLRHAPFPEYPGFPEEQICNTEYSLVP